ncbi:hypothetical protein DTO169E5_8470 [Paecilomyces variotii]|nr:hypothetical protein DTO169E5_8470 [Paecilomyces variotii]KAJ9267838.1 hypothetical protein DTO195F2_172 [Paecilomyces variotii]
MVVCTYFQQGRCRFGDRCKYEHPGQPTLGSNRFGVLSGSGGGSTSSGGFGDVLSFAVIGSYCQRVNVIIVCGFGLVSSDSIFSPLQLLLSLSCVYYSTVPKWFVSIVPLFNRCHFHQMFRNTVFINPDTWRKARSSAQSQQTPSYGVTAADIRADLSAGKGRPEWIFSSYGPGKNAPRQLFGGPQREQSFEEMRLRHYEAAAAGNPTPAIQEAEALYAECLKQMDTAINDADGAVRYVVEGEKEHPNRIDITEGRTGPAAAAAGQGTSAFGQANSAFGQPAVLGGTQSAFGKPTALGQQPAFGQPAFGQPSFGQPSTLGQKPAFGQPSSLGQGAQGSAFGQPSALGSSQSAFGKPAFGQPSFGQPGFGQPAFGKPSVPSPFGQAPTTGSGFSQLSSGPSPFGQPAGPAAGTGFGQPSTTTASPFGQAAQSASPFAQVAKTENPFGQPSTTASPFGAPAQQPAPSGFGQPPAATTASPFGQPPTAPTATQAAPQPAPAAGLGPRPQLKVDDPKQLNPLPNLTGQTVRDPLTKKLTMWKGQPVKYIDDWPCYLHPDDRQTYVHIFFPDGPPDQASLRDAQGKPEEYTPEVTEQYEFFVKNGFFKDGVIPSVPPKTEWVSFDF